MKPSVGVVILVASLAANGCVRKIRLFTALPTCVCRGAAVRVTWDATRRPVLLASPRPSAEWSDGEVASSGQREVAVEGPTEFRLTVPGANPAAGEGRRVQNVAVVEPRMPRAVVGAVCDAAARVVRGPVAPFASCGMALARMSSPQVALADDTTQPRRICLVRPGGERFCADAGGVVLIGASIDAQWQIEVPLAADERCAPGGYPTLASMIFDVACGG